MEVKSTIQSHWCVFCFFAIRKFNPVLWALLAASIAWLPEQLKWRRPWRCRHCWENQNLLQMFSHTFFISLSRTPRILCFSSFIVSENEAMNKKRDVRRMQHNAINIHFTLWCSCAVGILLIYASNFFWKRPIQQWINALRHLRPLFSRLYSLAYLAYTKMGQ